MRFANHPTFSRMVFDWQENVDYRPHLAEGKLEITFQKAATPNLSGLMSHPINLLTDPEYRIDGGNLIVSFTLTEPAKLKHFRLDTKIVFVFPLISLAIIQGQYLPGNKRHRIGN